MPWRTVLEVAGHWGKGGHKTLVLSGDGAAAERIIAGMRILYVARPKARHTITTFVQLLAEHGIERLYFPIAPGRSNRGLASALKKKGIAVVWYFPGSWYSTGQVLRALWVMPWRSLVSYVFQAIYPKWLWVRMLRGNGDLPIITMTPFTARRLRESGYPRDCVFPILPGKATVAQEVLPVSEACRGIMDKVRAKRFFVFFGPANAIRGVFHLLRAYQLAAKRHPECHLVCLFRDDENALEEREVVRRYIERLETGCQLHAYWESVNASELDWFLQNCFAVMKPFVIVPSEIPLAVIEAAEYGKPVIGFGGDGTGEFIAKTGVAVKRFSSRRLAETMMRLLDLPGVHRERCVAARGTYDQHPTWDSVAAQWLLAGGKVIERSA